MKKNGEFCEKLFKIQPFKEVNSPSREHSLQTAMSIAIERERSNEKDNESMNELSNEQLLLDVSKSLKKLLRQMEEVRSEFTLDVFLSPSQKQPQHQNESLSQTKQPKENHIRQSGGNSQITKCQQHDLKTSDTVLKQLNVNETQLSLKSTPKLTKNHSLQ